MADSDFSQRAKPFAPLLAERWQGRLGPPSGVVEHRRNRHGALRGARLSGSCSQAAAAGSGLLGSVGGGVGYGGASVRGAIVFDGRGAGTLTSPTQSKIFQRLAAEEGKGLAVAPLETKIRLLVEILRGVAKMERGGYIHGGVSPYTVLLFGDCSSKESCDAKLGGLGWAHPVDEIDYESLLKSATRKCLLGVSGGHLWLGSIGCWIRGVRKMRPKPDGEGVAGTEAGIGLTQLGFGRA